MLLINPSVIKINTKKVMQIEKDIKSIYRYVLFNTEFSDDDLLKIYINSITDLKDLLILKNAQLEAQTNQELEDYLRNLTISLSYIVEKIKLNLVFSNVFDLMDLFRLISPEAHSKHPNKFRNVLVQVGSYVCPEPRLLPDLVLNFFENLNQIENPIIKGIYAHHELVRIHPFIDGNGRVARMVKNWILLFDLYPPIFVNGLEEKNTYVLSLAKSFQALENAPENFGEHTANFFDQELDRLIYSIKVIRDNINHKI